MDRSDTLVRTSTSGDSPETVIVSATAAADNSALIGAVNDARSTTQSTRTVCNPGNPHVNVLVPGRRSTTRYCPRASVTLDWTPPMSAGLEISTVTPGS